MRRPSGDTSGPAMNRACGAVHTSTESRSTSRHRESPAAVDETYIRWPWLQRGYRPEPVDNGMGAGAAAPASVSVADQKVRVGVASVAASRAPSPLAESDVYRST